MQLGLRISASVCTYILYICNASGMQSAHAHCRSRAPRPAECMYIGPGQVRGQVASPARRGLAGPLANDNGVACGERGDCLGPEWSDIVYISIATACNGITFTTKYNTPSTDHDKGEFIPDCCIASREAPPAYHTYALV